MRGVGIAFSRFLEVDIDTGVCIGMAIVFVYAVFGGMKGITYTQVAQYCVLIFAYTIPAIFISLQLTGNAAAAARPGQLRWRAATCRCWTSSTRSVTDLGFGAYTDATARSMLNMFLHHAVADDRHRRSAARHHPLLHRAQGADARISAGWALVFIAILYTTAPAVARWPA